MNSEKPEECEKCGGTGWIQTGTRRDSGVVVPVKVPCDCRKEETGPSDKTPQDKSPRDKTSDFIGRVVLDSPEKFRS